MKVQGLTPILNVANLDESFAWFEKLGWKKAICAIRTGIRFVSSGLPEE